MAQRALSTPPPGFDELSTDEQVEYVQALWDRIAARPEAVPVPDWHIEVLKERLADHLANPRQGLPLEESLAQVNERLKDSRSRRG